MDPIFVFAGAISGLLIGLTGVGGGAIMTPLLIMAGVTPLTAVATDLWFAAITKSVGIGVFYKSGLIDWGIVRKLWKGSLSTSLIILLLITFSPIGESSSTILISSVSIMVVLTAIGLILKPMLHDRGKRFRVSAEDKFKSLQSPLTVISGVLLGSVVTLTSVGAGAIGVVVLSCLYPLRLTAGRLIATDVAHAIPLALFAGIGHSLLGNVDLTVLVSTLLGSLPAVLVGSKLASIIPDSTLRYMLAAVLAVAGLNLWPH